MQHADDLDQAWLADAEVDDVHWPSHGCLWSGGAGVPQMKASDADEKVRAIAGCWPLGIG